MTNDVVCSIHAVKDTVFVRLACVDFAKNEPNTYMPVAISHDQLCMRCKSRLENIADRNFGCSLLVLWAPVLLRNARLRMEDRLSFSLCFLFDQQFILCNPR